MAARRRTTLSVSVSVSERGPSVTWTTNVNAPSVVGVPESSPLAESVIPVGSVPDWTFQLWLPPPDAVSWELYGSLT